MAVATILPTASQLKFFYWQNKPILTVGLSQDSTDTTAYWSTPPLDETGAIITGGFLMGITNKAGKTEQCWVAAGAVAADGLSATVVRGIDPKGLDYTVGDDDFILDLDGGSTITCVIAAQDGELLRAALQGIIATGGSGIIIGTDALGTVTLYRSTGAGTYLGFMRWNIGNTKTEYANNGLDWNAIDNVTGSNLVVVTASDTTPGNLNNKTSSGTGITRTVLNPGANELLQFSVNGTLANLISDVTATATEINQALDGISANVTFTNLNTLTAGPLSDAAALHTHSNIPIVSDVGTLGENVSASDITNNLNLVYFDRTTGKWFKVTSSASTWYSRLGLVLQAGVTNDSVSIMLKGPYAGKSFSNINPTFSSALTGTDVSVGLDAATRFAAFKIDNTAAAEAVLSGAMTISAKQTGTPSGAMLLYLVLAQNDQSGYPAAVFDATNKVANGAIIASGSIAQALFSGTYASLPCTLSAAFTTINIPANANVYLVVAKTGDVDVSNYYQVQSNAATALFNQTTQTWSGTANAGNCAFTVTSTSPIGYGVKAYNGSNGSFGLTPSNAWAKVIGIVVSATSMYFDPEQNRSSADYANNGIKYVGMTPINKVTTNFCPSSVKVSLGSQNKGTASQIYNFRGVIRGDSNDVATFRASGKGSTTNLDNFLGTIGGASPPFVNGSTATLPLAINVTTSTSVAQNYLQFVRLEVGYYVYPGYPAGSTGYIDGGNSAGFVGVTYTLDLESKI